MGTAETAEDPRDLLANVEPRWHRDFLEFIQTGDARPEFLAYVDTSESCQKAIEMAFDTQVAGFDRLARAMHAAETASAAPPMAAFAEQPRIESAVFSVLTTLRNLGVLSSRERQSVLQKAVADFTASAEPSESRTVIEVTDALGKEIGRAVASETESGQPR